MENNSKRLLGSMNIDFDKFDETDEEGRYLYRSPTVLSTRKRSVYLPHESWNGEAIKATDEQVSFYTTIPIRCKGEQCDFADTCPLVKNNLVTRWLNSPCVLEVINGFRHFAGYVNDLDIEPTDYTDLMLINDLVRLHIQMERCDKQLQIEKSVENVVDGTDANSSLKHSLRQQNAHLKSQEQYRKDINNIYKLLVASRQAKLEAESRKKTATDMSVQLAQLLADLKTDESGEEQTAQRMNHLEI